MKKKSHILSVIVVIIVLFSSCSNKAENSQRVNNPFLTSVDLDDSFTIEYSGYNGNASVDFDYSLQNVAALVSHEKVSDYLNRVTNGENLYLMDFEQTLDALIDIELQEEYANLSNGDKVMVQVILNERLATYGETLESLQKGLGISFDTSFQYTVSGLKDGKCIDIFSYLEPYIIYKGANGSGQIQIDFPYSVVAGAEKANFQIEDLYFSASGYESFSVVYNNVDIGNVFIKMPTETDFSKGDTYSINLNVSDDLKTQLGNMESYILSSKTYIVPDLGDYIDDFSLLSSENIISIKNAIIEHNPKSDEYDTAELKEFNLCTIKPGSTLPKDEFSRISFIGFFINEANDPGILEASEYYSYVYIYNIKLMDDATVQFDVFDKGYTYDADWYTYEEITDKWVDRDNYTYTSVS